MTVLPLALNLLLQKDLGERFQFGLSFPISGHVVDDAGVDDVGVHHLHGSQIVLKRLSHQNGVGRQNFPQLLLDVVQPGLLVEQHFLGDTGVTGQVVDDPCVRFDECVVHDLLAEKDSALKMT